MRAIFSSRKQGPPPAVKRAKILTAVFSFALLFSYLISRLGGTLKWSTLEMALLIALFLLATLPASLKMLDPGRFDFFEPHVIFSIVFLVAFVIAPVIMIQQDDVGVRDHDYREQLPPALAIAAVALLGHYLGYLKGRGVFRRFWRRRPSEPRRQLDSGTIFWLSLLLLAITFAMYFLWIATAGIPLSSLNNLGEERLYGQANFLGSSTTLYLFLFRQSWPLLILLAWLHAPPRFWKFPAALAWLFSLALYILGGGRGTLFILLGSTVVLHYLRSGKRPSLLALFAILTTTVCISGYLVTARGRSSAAPDIISQAELEITDRGAITGLMAAAYVFPEQAPYMGLRALSDLIYAPIPRMLWPAKPSLRPVQDILNLYLPTRSHAPGVIGIYYAGFGPIGPFLILFAFGLLSAFIYEFWRHDRRSPFAQAILSGWLPFIWILIHRGVPSKHLIMVAYTFLPVVLIYFLASKASLHEQRKHAPAVQH